MEEAEFARVGHDFPVDFANNAVDGRKMNGIVVDDMELRHVVACDNGTRLRILDSSKMACR